MQPNDRAVRLVAREQRDAGPEEHERRQHRAPARPACAAPCAAARAGRTPRRAGSSAASASRCCATFSATTGISSIPTKAWTVRNAPDLRIVAPSTASSTSSSAATASVSCSLPALPPTNSALEPGNDHVGTLAGACGSMRCPGCPPIHRIGATSCSLLVVLALARRVGAVGRAAEALVRAPGSPRACPRASTATATPRRSSPPI